jgi:choline-sulfatase
MYDHVLLISLDTLRSDCINANPDKLWPDKYSVQQKPRTEVLDELVSKGTFFPNCISAAPYTSASHASFFTGNWPLRHGVYEFFNHRLKRPTVFTQAKRAGYRTIFKVDFPIILGPFLGFDRDIDQYIEEDDNSFLSALEQSARTFSFVHFGGLHIPYGFHNLQYGGERYEQKVAQLEQEIPAQESSLTDRLIESQRNEKDMDLLMRYKRIVQHHYLHGRYDKLFDLYLEGADFFFKNRFDPFFRKLQEKLGKKRVLIVIFGDHGEEYDADSYGHFNTLAEGVLRVPVIFYGQDILHQFCATRIRSIDVAPTLLGVLGFPASQRRQMDGTSLERTILEGAPYPARTAIAQAYTSDATEFVNFLSRVLKSGKKTGALRHVRYKEVVYDGGFKLLRQNYQYAEHGRHPQPCQPRIVLEHLTAEDQWQPFSDAAVASRLQAILDNYNRTRGRAQRSRAIPEEIRLQLQSLGYNV